MPSQPLSATLVPCSEAPGSAAPRGIATVSPLDDADAIDAVRRWHAHLDAGRLAYASPPSPDRHAQEARIHALEAMLGLPRRTIR